MRSSNTLEAFPIDVQKFATEFGTPEAAAEARDLGAYRDFHAAAHNVLQRVRDELAAEITPPLIQEKAVEEERTRLPIYVYWFFEGDAVFLQIDSRDPCLFRGVLNIVVSSEKDTAPERIAAMRDLALRSEFVGVCRSGRRNTRWSFLYLEVPFSGPDGAKGAAQRIAPVMRALHKLDHTNFPRTHTGRFR
jgi:hypothetical protein